MAISSARSVNGNTKSAIAKQIYAEMLTSNNTFTRKDVIARFVSEAGLTSAGAATYYFNITKKSKSVEAESTETESTNVEPEVPATEPANSIAGLLTGPKTRRGHRSK